MKKSGDDMYVHIGGDMMVRSSDLIAIIEKETVEDSYEIQLFLDRNKHRMIELANGCYKSLVITVQHIYLSPIASVTIKKRFKNEKEQDLFN